MGPLGRTPGESEISPPIAVAGFSQHGIVHGAKRPEKNTCSTQMVQNATKMMEFCHGILDIWTSLNHGDFIRFQIWLNSTSDVTTCRDPITAMEEFSSLPCLMLRGCPTDVDFFWDFWDIFTNNLTLVCAFPQMRFTPLQWACPFWMVKMMTREVLLADASPKILPMS